MTKKLFIDYSSNNIRTALTVNDKLSEIYIDPPLSGSWVGKIIVGRIQTILPGQFAFIDIGASKNAFINLPENHGLKSGQPILVQVQKDASGKKGAYLTSEINLKGHLVILYEHHEIGVSRKITDEKEKIRLKKIAKKHAPKGFGLILRTNAENVSAELIIEEINTLYQQYIEIKNKANYARPPAILFPEKETNENTLLKDLLSEDLTEIHINGDYLNIKDSILTIMPSLESRIHHHEAEENLFDTHRITKQIKNALKRTVNLPCGGACTFEETEACVVIDVNTGSNIGKTSYAKTILQTNMEAAEEITHQLTLRNLSGIILIDFIDMHNEDDKTTLLTHFTKEISNQRIKPEIIGFIGLGMVQLTRRKTRPSLSSILEEKCPHCGGLGLIQKHTKNPKQ